MYFKNIALFLVLFVFVNVQAHVVRRDAEHVSQPQPNILDSFEKNMMQFRKCIDQSLAMAVDEVNTKQLKPVLSAVSDSLNRVSMAFDDLTKPATKKNIDIPIEEDE